MIALVRYMGFRMEGAVACDSAIEYAKHGTVRLAWRVRYGGTNLYMVVYRQSINHGVLIWVYTEAAWKATGTGPFMDISKDGAITYTYTNVVL